MSYRTVKYHRPNSHYVKGFGRGHRGMYMSRAAGRWHKSYFPGTKIHLGGYHR